MVLALGAVAGVAYGGAGRVKVLTAAGKGLEVNADADGGVIMNFHSSAMPKTDIQLSVRGLEPNKVYGVQIDPGLTSPLAFITNANGNGRWHGSVGFDIVPLNPVVRVFVFDNNILELGHVSFDELRVIGCLTDACSVGDACSTDADCDDLFLCTDDSCDGGFCFHAPHDCGLNSFCSLTLFNCETGCVETCTTDGEDGCCNTVDPCPGPDPPGICPCVDGNCGCERAPCP